MSIEKRAAEIAEHESAITEDLADLLEGMQGRVSSDVDMAILRTGAKRLREQYIELVVMRSEQADYEDQVQSLQRYIGELEARISKLEQQVTRGVRRTDPETSRLAWEYSEQTRNTNLGKIAEHFMRYPSSVLTAEQIEQATGVRSAWKRVSELVKLAWLEVAGEAVASTGAKVRTYRIHRDRHERIIDVPPELDDHQALF